MLCNLLCACKSVAGSIWRGEAPINWVVASRGLNANVQTRSRQVVGLEDGRPKHGDETHMRESGEQEFESLLALHFNELYQLVTGLRLRVASGVGNLWATRNREFPF